MRKLGSLVLLVLCFSTLSASSLLELVGAPDSPNPFNARIIAIGAEAAYFNPALLVGQPDSVKLGFFLLTEALNIDHYTKPEGYDVSKDIYAATSSEINKVGDELSVKDRRYTPIATLDLKKTRGNKDYFDMKTIISLGVAKNIIDNWLTAGVYALLPATSVQTQTPFFADEREQFASNSLHFELLEDRSQQFNIAIALGGKISSFLKLGAGISFTSYTVTNNDVFVPDKSNMAFQLINTNLKVTGSISPHFSFVAIPYKDLFITGTAHLSANSGEIKLNNYMQIPGMPLDTGELTTKSYTSTMTMVYGYQPMRFSLGAKYDFHAGKYAISPVFQSIWTFWSSYINRHGEKPLDKWDNVFSFFTGVNANSEDRSIGLDIAYVPTPVPDQTGRTNYVDNSRVAFALGWTEFFKLRKVTIAGGINAQLHYLIKRSVTKDINRPEQDGGIVDEFPDSLINPADGQPFASAQGLQSNNPGFPGFSSGGFIVGTGFFVKLIY